MAAALLALVVAALTMQPVTAASTPRAAGQDCAPDVGIRSVVVLVHGFHSDVSTWTKSQASMVQAVHGAAPGKLYVRLFDYGRVSTQWVTNPQAGPALAQFVRCLAAASTAAGGSGKVVLVGHSMGGLVIRCALDPTCATDHPLDRRLVGMIVTLGTPHTGSFLRPSSAADVADTLAGSVANALCDTAQIVVWPLTGACDTIRSLGTSPAGRAFTIGSTELNNLAPFPDGIPVRAIAGSGRVATGVGIWPPRPLMTSMGDLVVSVDSQLAEHTDDRLGGTRTIDCGEVTATALMRCWHLTETSYAPFRAAVAQAVADYLNSQTRAVGPSSAAWWQSQTYPTGWESGGAVTFRTGKQIRCNDPSAVPCQFSLQGVAVLQGPGGQLRAAVLLYHEIDGSPVAQTLMVFSHNASGLTLAAASNSGLAIPEDRKLCQIRLSLRPDGSVTQSFHLCTSKSAEGTVLWRPQQDAVQILVPQ